VSAALSDAAAARRLVEARLGRDPQDMLEAAVVLEAWGGLPAQRALDMAGALMTTSPSPSRPSTGTLPVPRRQPGVVLEAAAFVLTVLAVALWAAPLAAGLGTGVVERALIVALPLTLALQWGLRSRYLGRPKGLLALARRRRALLVGGCALVALPAALLGLSGLVAGLLTLTWMGGTLLMRRGWTGAYTAIVIGGTFPMMADIPPLATLGGIAGATTLAVVLALRAAAPSTRIAVGRWDRAFVGAALGAGIGIMLVGDSSVTWTEGTVPALALLPSTAAGFWGGYHLWKIEHVIPHALLGVPAADVGARAAASAPLRTLLGATARLVGLTAILSAALVLLTPWLDATPSRAGVLVGFGLLALATLLVSLLEVLGRGFWALLSVIGGLAAEALVALQGTAPFPGAGLVAGSGLVVVLLLPAAIALISHPARTLATALWIR
jgi:hypothetical protein